MRTEGIFDGEDAIKQRVQCRTCKHYFALAPSVKIPAHPGRPKVSRRACICGSTNVRRKGWEIDGRQKVCCNYCRKTFALPLGEVAIKRACDSMGRPMQYSSSSEHEWQLPDPAEEAHACFILAKSESSFEETRNLILVTGAEARQLDFLCRYGLFDPARVEAVLDFREKVLEIYDRLVRAEHEKREGIV